MRLRRGRLAIALMTVALTNVACGFHLRGGSGAALPDSLTRLRVAVEGSQLANDPLLALTKNALLTDPKVVVTDELDSISLLLSGERVDIQTQSTNITGRASSYTMKYEVSYRVVDASGKELVALQRVRFLRDYTFDPINVLAKEREEQDLKRTMQRDAIQQILRRLARYAPPGKPADAAQP